MIASDANTVNSTWIAPNGIFMWGTRASGGVIDPVELKNQLFAWHAPSFYGTFIEIVVHGHKEGVLIPATMALDYFCSAAELQHVAFVWDSQLAELRCLAPAVREALTQGHCMPDYAKWKQGKLGWKLQLVANEKNTGGKADEADVKSGIACENGSGGEASGSLSSGSGSGEISGMSSGSGSESGSESGSGEVGGSGVGETSGSLSSSGSGSSGSSGGEASGEVEVFSPMVGAWMDSLISEWVRERPEFKQLLQNLEQAHPMPQSRQPSDLWLDEEDWLVAIGWEHDPSPFRTCLQLIEPEDGREWRLQVLLQDRKHADLIIASSPQGVPAEADASRVPAAWLADLARVRKDVQRWLHILPSLRDSAEPARLREELSHDEAWEFLAQASLRLVEAGCVVFLPAWWERLRKLKPRIKAKLKSSVGAANNALFGLGQIMQFDWKLAIGDVELTEAEFRELAEQKRKLVQFRGKWIQLDATQLDQIQQVIKQVKKKKGLSFRDVMEMHLLGPTAEEADPFETSLEETQTMEIELNDHLLHLLAQLNQQATIPDYQTPASFHGSLRHYQSAGVSWMLFLRRFGLGGCLADDMGLGKTIQWITYLLIVKESAQSFASLTQSDTHLDKRTASLSAMSSAVPAKLQPSLLICPTSVLGNWQKELQRFAPSLRIHLHYGSQRMKGEAFTHAIENVDLVLTSYTLSHLDEQELTSLQWGSICIDEAQNIKNAYTKQATSIRRLQGDHRIALTGTPIENRLTELWSIFEFLNPSYLGTLRGFSHHFVSKIEKTRDTHAISQVQKLIRPFLMRREKKDPAIQLDLPDKNEMKTYVSLTAEQASLYENYIENMFTRLDQLKPMERRGMILTALTRLKQICNHPALLLKEGVSTHRLGRSNKVERLLDLVSELRQEGDRCLIFTQFVETGQLLQNILQKELREKVQFLHGGTPKAERDRIIGNFQDLSYSDGNNIFILSLKAGGTGLNLTAANHVFHFDRWWNPAVENQATDRAYRIGQTQHVQVRKFVTLGTLEERIDEMIERKQGLSQQIVGGGEAWITEMSTADLQELFALRRDWVEA